MKTLKNALKACGSLKVSIFLFLVFAFFCAIATFIESAYSTPTAWVMVYGTAYFGFIQLLLGLNLICAVFRYKLFRLAKAPLLVFHLSFLLILIGAAMTRYLGYEGLVHIRENDSASEIESADSFVYFATLNGDKPMVSSLQTKIALLPFVNSFKLRLDLDGENATLKYKNLLLDVEEKVVEDENGVPLVLFMINDEKGAREILLNEGEITSVGGVNFAFLNDAVPPPFVKIDGDLNIVSSEKMDFLAMDDEKNGVLPSEVPSKSDLKRLFSIKDINFVVKFASLKAKIDFVGKNRPQDESFGKWLASFFGKNDEKLALSQNAVNALQMSVSYKGESKDVVVLEHFEPVAVNVGGQTFFVSYKKYMRKMPFELHLKDFVLDRYPGSNSPSSYASEVEVRDGDTSFDYRIFMNNVLDYKGFRFYQSSYDTDEKGTILSVNKDPGKIPTYIGYFLLFAGMFFSLLNPKSRFRTLARMVNEDALKSGGLASSKDFSEISQPALKNVKKSPKNSQNSVNFSENSPKNSQKLANDVNKKVNLDEKNGESIAKRGKGVSKKDDKNGVKTTKTTSKKPTKNVAESSKKAVKRGGKSLKGGSLAVLFMLFCAFSLNLKADEIGTKSPQNAFLQGFNANAINQSTILAQNFAQNSQIILAQNSQTQQATQNLAQNEQDLAKNSQNSVNSSTQNTQNAENSQNSQGSQNQTSQNAQNSTENSSTQNPQTTEQNATQGATMQDSHASVLSPNAQRNIEKRAKPIANNTHGDDLASLVVQSKGRMMPFDTLSRELLGKIYKKDNFDGANANAVIMAMYVFPQWWAHEQLIIMPKNRSANDEIASILGLSSCEKPAKQCEKGVKYIAYSDFFTSDGEYKLTKYVENANRKNPNARGVFEKELIKLDERANIVNMIFSGDLLNFYPLQDEENDTWINAEQSSLLDGVQKRAVRDLMRNYNTAFYLSIVENNEQYLKEALELIKAYQKDFGARLMPSESKIKTEIFVNNAQIFVKLTPIYLLAGLLLLFIVLFKMVRPKTNIKTAFKCVYAINILAFIAHTAGLCLRAYLADHAPWSNAYESMIYIAWALGLSGIFFSRKSPIALSLTSILAGLVLWVAHLGEMDPQITNLVPVLDSYWLSIHVSVITASYGFLGLCTLLGIFVLVLLCFMKKNGKHNENIARNITEATRINEMAMILGLILLTIGNFLGAIWANESWGRYWSWDSKETWALISILIYAAVLHIRLVPSLANQFNFAVASMFAYWSIIMTYFGVNYFLVGMHSYAAGDAAKIPMSVYIGIAFMVFLSILSYFKRGFAGKL